MNYFCVFIALRIKFGKSINKYDHKRLIENAIKSFKFYVAFWLFKRIQPSAAFHIETSPIIYSAIQVTGFYMKSNTGLKWNIGPKELYH